MPGISNADPQSTTRTWGFTDAFFQGYTAEIRPELET